MGMKPRHAAAALSRERARRDRNHVAIEQRWQRAEARRRAQRERKAATGNDRRDRKAGDA